jgi:hypothetical protein
MVREKAQQYGGVRPADQGKAAPPVARARRPRDHPGSMARAHGIAVLGTIALGTALWLVLAQANEPAPPPAPARPAADPQVPALPATARQPLPGPQVPEPPGPARALPPEPPPAPASRASVDLRAADLGTRAPLAAFRWRFRPDADGDAGGEATAAKGDGAAGEAAVALPPGAVGELLVEADGYAPERCRVAVPRLSSEPLRVETLLSRAVPLSGVVLHATDDDGWPVRRLRIDVWQLEPSDPDPDPGTDPASRLLWARTGTSEDGRFPLPALPPGRFALRAQPTGADDAALGLLPWRTVIHFGGSESLPFTISFARGVVLAIEALPGTPPRDWQVRVHDDRGTAVPVLWRSLVDDAAVVARDAVTLPGRATSLLALPDGDYRIELWRGDQKAALAPATAAARVLSFRAELPR